MSLDPTRISDRSLLGHPSRAVLRASLSPSRSRIASWLSPVPGFKRSRNQAYGSRVSVKRAFAASAAFSTESSVTKAIPIANVLHVSLFH